MKQEDVKLSVIIPVYNERETFPLLVQKVKQVDLSMELVVVDDYSTDGTRDIIKKMENELDHISFHDHNRGKGAAIRTGLKLVSGNVVVIQDADLEYDPEDYFKLLKPIISGKAEVVYGSRFTGERRDMFITHWMGNRLLTFITNILYGTTLSDMETCYKMFKIQAMEGIHINSDRFNVEPELTAKFLKKGIRIYEVPISYAGREYHEGKKITWRDGFNALWALIKYRFTD